MQAYVTACRVMDLQSHGSAYILEHFAFNLGILHTFWNILHAFWNIKHASWNILDHLACILEHSGTFFLHTVKEFQLGTQTDTQTLGLSIK